MNIYEYNIKDISVQYKQIFKTSFIKKNMISYS